MKSKFFFTVMALLMVLCSVSFAQVPQLINYQGKLTKSTGAPLDTTIQMVFTIYADSNGTTSKWSESQSSVNVEKGVFNVLLGSTNAIPDSVFDGSIRYLGVKIGSDPEITPRKPMVSVPYARTDGDWIKNGDHIYRDGSVSIGVHERYAALSVQGDSAGDGIVIVENPGGTTGLAILDNMLTGNWNPLVQSGDDLILWKGSSRGNPDAGGLVIAPWDTTLRGIRIDYRGNVGIGTPSPQRALHISDILRLEPRALAPADPSEGDIYVNSTNHHIYCYPNGVWKQLDN